MNKDNLLFQDEDHYETSEPTGEYWKVLIIDDEEEVHRATRLILSDFEFEGRGLKLISGYSETDARRLLNEHPDAAIMLLDVVMESDQSGLNVVSYIREEIENRFIRIILRTGQPGQAPEQEVLAKYDINDYEEKADMTSEKLMTVIMVSLRAYRDLRTLELLAQKAEAANKAKSDFLNMISHELRTPLTVVMGNLSELKKPELLNGPDEIREIAGDALNQAEHLLTLINDVLDLSKIETGKLELFRQPVVANEAVEEAINLTRSLAEKKGLTIDNAVESDLTVNVDLLRLRQIFVNLLSNAVKFTEHGGITVRARQDGKFAVFEVRDTGCGIPEEKYDMVFRAFEQVDNSSTRAAGGTGLGLPITLKLVHMHGGEIWFDSKEGKGSVFTFTMPLV